MVRKIMFLITAFLVIANVILFVCSIRRSNYLLKEGELIKSYKDIQYLCKASMFVVSENYIYVLFSDRDAVKVYDTQGRYLHSLIYYDSSRNGASSIYEVDQCIYLITPSNSIYMIRDGEYIEYYSFQTTYGRELYYKLKKSDTGVRQKGLNGTSYYLSATGSIIEEGMNRKERIVVIHRPFYMMAFQLNLYYVTVFAILLSYAIYKRYKGKK